MNYGVIWKSCQYLYGLVIIKLLLWRAVLIMWTTHISKWQSALQRKKLIKIIQVEKYHTKKTADEIKSSSKFLLMKYVTDESPLPVAHNFFWILK
ncbi:hypothetical protein pdam_00022073, partial [Pocillopora damicornis]